MGKHRLEPPTRVRPRFGRIAAAAVSLTVTGIAVLAEVGVIPIGVAGSAAGHDQPSAASSSQAPGVGSPAAGSDSSTPKTIPSVTPTATPSAKKHVAKTTTKTTTKTATTALPADAGSGRRVVFSMSDQRVWLVNAKGKAFATYLVSGSLTDNLHPGKYDVYSRSRWAVGVDDSGVMQYFVRFTRGNNAAIGFHSIPTKNGQALQTTKQLGTPQSHGCIRQKLSDAKKLWDFAPDGTDVVVVA